MESSKNLAAVKEEKYSSEEVLDIIKNKMENSERWDLLEKMHESYYNTRSDKTKVLG